MQGDYSGIGRAIAGCINDGIDAVQNADVSIGKEISSWINNAVSVAAGFVDDLDWVGIGDVIHTNLIDLLTGFDFGSAISFLGDTAGSLGSMLVAAVGGEGLVVDMQARFTTWKENLKNKTVDFKASFVAWNDRMNNKVVNFSANFNTWMDRMKNKTTNFLANVVSWTDNMRNKVSNFKANFNSWKDSLPDKITNFKANLTTWKDSLPNKIANFKANLTTWKDGLSDKWLEFKANIKRGWSGSLAKLLGIDSITSKLNMKLPEISIDWGYATALGKTWKYPKGFDIKWNATGAILNGAQIFGRVGNTFLGGGEAGREAVLPLDRHTGWMDKIADRVALKVVSNDQGGEQTININLIVDGKILASTMVRHVNAQAKATGKNPLSAYM